MKNSSPAEAFRLASIDELLGEEDFQNSERKGNDTEDIIILMDISRMHGFKGHPFKDIETKGWMN